MNAVAVSKGLSKRITKSPVSIRKMIADTEHKRMMKECNPPAGKTKRKKY